MILRTPRGRSGITLTEIPISILIMGKPRYGLHWPPCSYSASFRLCDATRMSRSATLTRVGHGDHETRDLLNKLSFLNANYAPLVLRKYRVLYASRALLGDMTLDPRHAWPIGA